MLFWPFASQIGNCEAADASSGSLGSSVIRLMRDFGAEFGGHFADSEAVHSTVDLGRTFRSVDKIAYPARCFVLRNPAQIEKMIVPAAKVASSSPVAASLAR